MKKLILLLFIILLVYLFINNKELNSNPEFINKVMKSSNLYVTDEKTNISIKPIAIIDRVFALESNYQEFSYIQNLVIDSPRVYIYNTHADEKYLENKETVVNASLLLQEKLNNLGIQTLVESRNAYLYVKNNNLAYPKTYSETRKYLTEALEKNKFDLIIDLHRDSVPSGVSTLTTIGNKKYAKVMFVMNKKYDNYNLAVKLNNIINKNYNTLSRNIYDTDDHFNQDVNEKVILLELGSKDNSYDEVKNTIDALAISIKGLLNEEN